MKKSIPYAPLFVFALLSSTANANIYLNAGLGAVFSNTKTSSTANSTSVYIVRQL